MFDDLPLPVKISVMRECVMDTARWVGAKRLGFSYRASFVEVQKLLILAQLRQGLLAGPEGHEISWPWDRVEVGRAEDKRREPVSRAEKAKAEALLNKYSAIPD